MMLYKHMNGNITQHGCNIVKYVFIGDVIILYFITNIHFNVLQFWVNLDTLYTVLLGRLVVHSYHKSIYVFLCKK